VRRRCFAAACLTGALTIVTVGLTVAPAYALPPRDKGWWTVTNPLPAPDVPAGGLLVQGGPGGSPTAFAAVLYELDPGMSASTLTLTMAANSATTSSATLDLCPLTQPIVHPDEGGPMSDAPPYNCGKKVSAKVGSNGKDYQFAISGLVTDRLVAVAILPDGPVDRVVLSAPDANSLATQQAPLDSTSAGLDSGTASVISPSDSTATLPTYGFPAAPLVAAPTPGAAVSTGSPTASASAPATVAGSDGTGNAFLPAVRGRPKAAAPFLVVLLIVGVLGGAALWMYAGRQRDAVALSGPSPG
jgi:hypothetical protein